jgi:choline dehydrogenase
MLADAEDVKVLIAAGKLCRQLLETKDFRPYVHEEIAPGAKVQSDQDWEEFVRSAASSGAHQCGTCKMGIDQMAVVDPQLRVHGIERLRVIDASIIPTVPSGNINASCMMIGEKGAQLILQERTQVPG